MSPIDDFTPEELAALEQTARSAKLETQTVCAQITITAGLLNALPSVPVLPSLVFRRPGSSLYRWTGNPYSGE